MNKLYDNGCMLIGNVKKVKKYLEDNKANNEDLDVDIVSLLEDLKDLKENDIVCFNYDNLNYCFDCWSKNDEVK